MDVFNTKFVALLFPKARTSRRRSASEPQKYFVLRTHSRLSLNEDNHPNDVYVAFRALVRILNVYKRVKKIIPQ